MKIAIGINSFKQEANLEKREALCLESLRKCRDETPDITLYNVIHISKIYRKHKENLRLSQNWHMVLDKT